MINLLATMGFGTGSVPSSVILGGFVVNPVEPASFFGCAFTIDDDRGNLATDATGATQANKVLSMESDLCQ